MYIASIALNIPLRTCYQYYYHAQLALGSRVLVTLKNKPVIGFVIKIVSTSTLSPTLKPIIEVSDSCYNLSNDSLMLFQFVAKYYHYPLGATIFTALPSPLKNIKIIKYNEKYFKTTSRSKTEKQNLKTYSSKTHQFKLTSEQKIVTNLVCNQADKFNTFLLYGVTGSGKTEVYLQIIEFYLQIKKQILVLIPEINLTPQLATRFNSKFNNQEIFIINSNITPNKRFQSWILSSIGQANIIIGTRLAVFTPFKNLGLIIVDEEHDKSFKQNDHLRYQARDLAIWRAKYHNIPIILGSATPSIESFYNLQQKKYHYLELLNRAVPNSKLPSIKIIDTKQHVLNDSGLSKPALNAIKTCLDQNEMCLVFINKRGFAPILKCNCGWQPSCKNCSIKLVCHLTILKCHHCNYNIEIPTICPKCQQKYLYTLGYGTQKVEAFLEQYLCQQSLQPKILRIDKDTTSNKKAWDNIYKQINNNQVNLLIGTQMLAKGHDFANLTLVVIIDSDYLLYSSNFKAHEELYALSVQIAGRSGRSSKLGNVLIQTEFPNHKIYTLIKQQSYLNFAQQELLERDKYALPPFSYYATLKIYTNKYEQLITIINKVNQLLNLTNKFNKEQDLDKKLEIFPATVSKILKIKNQFRGHALIISWSRPLLHSYLDSIEYELTKISTNITIDVDPIEV